MKTFKDWRLVQEDWDFSKCPEKELYFCVQYEYARESKSIREYVARFKAEKLPFFIKPRNLDSQSTWDDLLSGMWTKTFAPVIFKEFPETPWLRLDPNKRKEISENIPPIIGQYSLSNISVRKLSKAERKGGVMDVMDRAIKKNTLGTHGVQFLTLEVDWRFSDEQLKRDFLTLRPKSVKILYKELCPSLPFLVSVPNYFLLSG